MNQEPQSLVCWKCGAPVVDEPLPLSRRAACRACGADLHVCRMCREHDPRIARQCREDRAEDVTEKDRANFCDWFSPRPDAYRPPDVAAADAARAELAALFGLDEDDRGPSGTPEDKAARARADLERLFGGGKPED